jgi:hypothetical protein
MGCHTGSFLLRLAPSPLVSWKGYEILFMGCGSFCRFRSCRLAYWEPDVGRGLCGHMDLSADNAEPFFKTLLKSVALAPTVAKRIGRKKARLTSSKRALVPS